MKEVCVLEEFAELDSRDPIDVIANAPRAAFGGRPLPEDLSPKTSFEIAWDLAH